MPSHKLPSDPLTQILIKAHLSAVGRLEEAAREIDVLKREVEAYRAERAVLLALVAGRHFTTH